MIGYMTNAFGPLVGTAGGVTCAKDIRYVTMCDDADVIKKISDIGFKSIEVLEGNLTKYSDNPDVLRKILNDNKVNIMSVCVGANFIYKDALEDELAHLEAVCSMAKDFSVKYLVICGGSIRAKGIAEGDCKLLAQALDKVIILAKKYNLTACFHPHLGSIAEKPAEIDKLFSESEIAVCPDLAHLQAGGYEPIEFLKKYYNRIAFVHLKDLDENGFAPLGTGNVNLMGAIDCLKAMGYNGDWLVEVDGYAGNPEKACKTCYDYLKGLLI